MELIRYWQIVRRRWWLVVGLLAVVAAGTLLTYDPSPPQQYTVSMRFNVGLEPIPPGGADYVYNPFDVWRSSEYLMDDLASAVRGAEYARRVGARLDDTGVNLAGRLSAATEFRVLTVSAHGPDPGQLAEIANAAANVLDEEAGELVGPLGDARPVLRLIDPPVVVPVGRGLREKLEIPIRLGLALMAGVAGAFLLDYLDRSVRCAEELEEAGISVLAQIPRYR
jgi:capsular polysaccharide biosynthesis protein